MLKNIKFYGNNTGKALSTTSILFQVKVVIPLRKNGDDRLPIKIFFHRLR